MGLLLGASMSRLIASFAGWSTIISGGSLALAFSVSVADRPGFRRLSGDEGRRPGSTSRRCDYSNRRSRAAWGPPQNKRGKLSPVIFQEESMDPPIERPASVADRVRRVDRVRDRDASHRAVHRDGQGRRERACRVQPVDGRKGDH